MANTGEPTTTFNCTTLSSGILSATWADIISATSDTLQEVLTAGNESDRNIVLKDDLITPTSTNTITPFAYSVINSGGGGLQISAGDSNVNGTASAVIQGTTAVNATMGLSCGTISSPPFFSPANTNITCTSTTSTASVALQSGGQFVNAKNINLDLDGLTHSSSDGNPNYTIQTNGNLDLNAGDASVGFKKVRINTNGTNPNQLTLEKQELRITDLGDPTGDSRCQLNSNQVVVSGKNPLTMLSYMTRDGFTTSDGNLSQSTAYQAFRTTTNKNYTIQNTGAVGSADLTMSTANGNVLMTSQNFDVNNGSIEIKSPTANLTVTSGSILYTNPSAPNTPFFISSQNDLTILSDNVDLSNTTMKLINASPSGVSAPQL